MASSEKTFANHNIDPLRGFHYRLREKATILSWAKKGKEVWQALTATGAEQKTQHLNPQRPDGGIGITGGVRGASIKLAALRVGKSQRTGRVGL